MSEAEGPSSTARMIAGAMILAERQGWSPRPSRDEVAWCWRFLQAAGAHKLLASIATTPGRWFWITLEFALAPGLIKHFLRRKAWLSEQCLAHVRDGPAQLVVLGAGLDPLPTRIAAEFPRSRVIEVEQASVAAARRRASSDLPNRHIVEGDLAEIGERGATFEALRERVDPNLPTVFLCEGVVMYLPRETAQRMFRAAAGLVPSATLLMTFMDRVPGRPVGFRPYRRLVRWWLQSQGEPFQWGATEREMEAMLAEARWRVAETVDEHRLAQRWPGRCIEGELLCRAVVSTDEPVGQAS